MSVQTTSNAVAQNQINKLINKLNHYDSVFGVDYENLMELFNEQMYFVNESLYNGDIETAKKKMDTLFTLFGVIKNKLSVSFFSNIEKLSNSIKYELKNN